ncbi:MAG: riboflavin synthase [Chloroflexi bacterium]|jgi:riboflavin synthase|nr:MAG: riboflavin synthase [Chloroflexota bacterium]
MFTGIVEEIGHLLSVEKSTLTIAARKTLDDLTLGGSIAVNGTCLTATSIGSENFSVEVTPETLRRTNLGQLAAGSGVNLERPLAVTDRLGGHIVQGHVDGTADIIGVTPEGNSRIIRFSTPSALMRYIAPKGFIAVDGISLTVVDIQEDTFTVSVIPTTYRETILGEKHEGDMVNLEVDILAKYVERLLAETRR